MGEQTKRSGGIPTFTPPGGAPTFTPPGGGAPIFTPPGGTGQAAGAVCYHHPLEPAAARCVRCGKYICKDCAEAYGVIAGEYAGKCLCYDCCEELVSQNLAELTRNKKKIKNQFILQIIGMVIGFIIGVSTGMDYGGFGNSIGYGVVFACIGGVFLSAVKAFFQMVKDAIVTAFSGGEAGIVAAILQVFLSSIIIIFKCIWVTLSNTVRYILYLKKTSGFIEQDSAALQQMRDYMQYTLVRSQNKGVDLDSLMSKNSELYNNSYAQAVLNRGEAAADADLRQATTRIAENGEIIRDFPNAA